MTWVERALGLKSLRFGAEGVGLEWARPLPAWAWALVVLAAAGIAGWSYWRLTGPRAARGVMGVLRTAVLILLAVIVSGPELVKRLERLERDWVVVLLDRSASMNVADVREPGLARMRTRDEQLKEAMGRAWPAWAEAQKERNVLWLGFDAGAYELRMDEDGRGAGGTPVPAVLGVAEGRRTSLGRAIEQGLRRVTARPVAGVVVVSDGRSADEPGKALVRRLQSEQIPVFSVPLGSVTPPADIAIRRVEAPRTAFADDLVPVSVEVGRVGGDEAGAGARPVVQLIDDATGAVLDEKPVTMRAEADSARAGGSGAGATGPGAGTGGAIGGPMHGRVTLTTKPGMAGRASWSVRVLPSGGPSGGAGELGGAGSEDVSPENNTRKLALDIVRAPVRVLQIDGYPRWEFRYLKNLLVREASMRSASLLLAADRRYIQEGTKTLAAVPSSPGEWAEFDVIVLGDVRPELFNPEQLEQIKEQVAQRGAGLLWIGGPFATPGAWAGTALADLLPFTLGGGEEGAERIGVWPGSVTMAASPEAERMGVLRLGDAEGEGAAWPGALSDASLGWTQLRWAQRIDPRALKPAAEVLATAAPVTGGGAATPVVIGMRYGSGRSVYVGTDEIWRWRYARGETLPERFWLPLVRMLARESLARSGQPATIEVSPSRAGVGQPVRVAVRLLDQSLADSAVSGVTVRITRGAGEPGDTARPASRGEGDQTRLKLAAETSGRGGAGRGGGARDGAGGGSVFTASWIPEAPGAYRFEIVDPPVGAGAGVEAAAEVTLPDDELREPAADHAALGQLSAQTSGRVVPPESLGEIPGMLPSRQIRIQGSPQVETLWDKPIVLALLVLLLAAEWIGRKVMRLA